MKSYFAPASTGNFSVGFDLLGAAFEPVDGSLFGDELRIHAEQAELSLQLTVIAFLTGTTVNYSVLRSKRGFRITI